MCTSKPEREDKERPNAFGRTNLIVVGRVSFRGDTKAHTKNQGGYDARRSHSLECTTGTSQTYKNFGATGCCCCCCCCCRPPEEPELAADAAGERPSPLLLLPCLKNPFEGIGAVADLFCWWRRSSWLRRGISMAYRVVQFLRAFYRGD